MSREEKSPRLRIECLVASFSAWVWREPADEALLAAFFRACSRVTCIVAQEFRGDKIPLRASALTFTVILSLVPLLALGTSVLKGVGGGGQMRQAVHLLISQMEVAADVDTNIPTLDLGGQEMLAMPLPQWSPTSLSGHLHRVADTVFDYVDKTKFATMGWVGIFALLFTVYALLVSIEKTFNAIWKTAGNRTLGRKLVDYLALLVLLPLTVNFGVAAMAALKSPRLLAHIQQALPWLGPLALSLLPAVMMVGTFSLLYSFLPNTKVEKGVALIGGVVGGLVWFLLQMVYFKLQIVVVRYNAIYGSFAALPLFLLWVYLSWVVFLLGAEVSFATQIRHRYFWRQQALSPIGRMALAFEILLTAAEDYRCKRLTTLPGLVWSLKHSDKDISELLHLLCGVGIMRFFAEGEGGYLPAAPLGELSVSEIGELILGEPSDVIPSDNPARQALSALRISLAESRLVARKM